MHSRIEEISDERDAGNGYQVAFKPGWKWAMDPLCPTHCFSADTKKEIAAAAQDAMPCDCQDCKKLIASAA